MSFCTECGTPATPDSAFCANCGSKLSGNLGKESPPSPSPQSTTGNENDWDAFFAPGTNALSAKSVIDKARPAKRHCIVLTDRKALQESLGDRYLDFEIALRLYCAERLSAGWKHHLLDASSSRLGAMPDRRWQSYVALLAQAKQLMEREGRAKPEAVLIVGDETIVPMAVFDNPLYDEFFGNTPDADVESDLPYATLVSGDPFVDDAALSPHLIAGRIPTGTSDSGTVGMNYFSHANAAENHQVANSHGFGVTAQVWEGASKDVASAIGETALHTSPELSLIDSPGALRADARYHYFNVHGSDVDKHWFGDGYSTGCIPVASPDTLKLLQCPNALATEACYGARFSGFPVQESALLSALGHKTIAFSGSSRIAYGPAVPPIGLADVVAREFLVGLKTGQSAGDAFAKGRETVLETPNLTPTDLLTVVEFNLFGDPTLVFSATPTAKTAEAGLPSAKATSKTMARDPLASVRSALDRSSGSLRLRMPDVLGDVRASLDSTWAGVRERLNKEISDSIPALRGVDPSVRRLKLGLERTETLQLVYGARNGATHLGRIFYADRSGKILRELMPK
jgi:hypothetical protein